MIHKRSNALERSVKQFYNQQQKNNVLLHAHNAQAGHLIHVIV